MPDAKNDVEATDERLIAPRFLMQISACPFSILLHQACILGFVKHIIYWTHVGVNLICIKRFDLIK